MTGNNGTSFFEKVPEYFYGMIIGSTLDYVCYSYSFGSNAISFSIRDVTGL